MREALGDIAVDATEQAMKSSNPVARALANGIGLIAVRVCVILLTAVAIMGVYIGQSTLNRIDGRITRMETSMDAIQVGLTEIRVDYAATKQRVRDLAATR